MEMAENFIWIVMMAIMKMETAVHLTVKLSLSIDASMEVRYQNPTVSMPLIFLLSYCSIRFIGFREVMQVSLYLS